jgi:penicillin amidase
MEKLLKNKPAKWLPKPFASYAELLKASEATARENLTRRLGADEAKWKWGEANKIRFSHSLAGAPLIGSQFLIPALPLVGAGGAGAAPNVGAGVSMRLVATPGNWDATLHGIPTGESGNPASPHWKDQLDSWYNGQTPVFPFSKTAVESAAREVWVMQPN